VGVGRVRCKALVTVEDGQGRRMADGRGRVECSREQQRIGEEMRRRYTLRVLGLGGGGICVDIGYG